MTKYIGTGVVWDSEKNKALMRFENGVFETDDSEIIDKMNALGYIPVSDYEKPKGKKK